MPIENHNSVFHDLDLSLLKHFFSVASYGGFSRAARATGQSQPALSLGLQKLEKSLGASLVARDSRQFELTESGQRLFEFCKRLEGSLQNVVGTMGTRFSPLNRRLKLGTAFSIGFGPLVEVCTQAARSGERIEIELESHATHQLIDALRSGALDACLIPDDTHAPDLTTTKISGDRIAMIASPRLAAAVTAGNWRKDLRSACLVTYMCETPMRAIVDRILHQESLEFRSSVSANSVDALKMLVAEGVGAAFISRSLVVGEIARGVLAEIPLPFPLPKCGMALATRSDEKGDAISEIFMKLLHAGRTAGA